MSGLISSGSFKRALQPIVRKWFGLDYKDYPMEYKEIYKELSSERAFEIDSLASGLGLPRPRTEGSNFSYDSAEQGYKQTTTHVEYVNGFVISRVTIEDNIGLDVARKLTTELKHSMLIGKEIQGALLLNRAFSSSYTFGDGKELCATDHPTLSSDVSNELATPTDIGEDGLEQALIDIASFKNNRGIRMAVQGMKLIIPKEEQFNTIRLINNDMRPGTADRDINASKFSGAIPQGMRVNHQLTDSDAWFIITDIPDGMIAYNRRPLQIESENDFDTDNAKFKATERYSFTVCDFRGIFGSPGA